MEFTRVMPMSSSSLCTSNRKQRVRVGGWLLLSDVGGEERNLRTPRSFLWELVRVY